MPKVDETKTLTLTPAMEKELREALQRGRSFGSVILAANLMPAALATIDQLRERVQRLENSLKRIQAKAHGEPGILMNSIYIDATRALNPEKEASHEPKP